MKLAIVLGLEEFVAYRNFKKVPYALADAHEMSNVLTKSGYEVRLLTGTDATFSKVTEVVHQVIASCNDDDEFWFFYAGHGAINRLNRTILACYDSILNIDFEQCLELRSVTNPFVAKPRTKAIFTIDACHSQLTPEIPPFNHFDDREILDITKSPNILYFTSCQSNEEALPDDENHHGIWTYHLLQCLKGLVPEALELGRYVDPYYLQGYLRNIVVAECERLHQRTQSPNLYGTFPGRVNLLDVVWERPVIQSAQVWWRISEWATENDNDAAFELTKERANLLINQLIQHLGATISFDNSDGEYRTMHLQLQSSKIEIHFQPKYRGLSRDWFVATDLYISTVDDAIFKILDSQICEYWDLRLEYHLDSFSTLFPANTILRLGSNNFGPIRVEISATENIKLQVTAEDIDPAKPALFQAHNLLVSSVLLSLARGRLTPAERETLASKCFLKAHNQVSG